MEIWHDEALIWNACCVGGVDTSKATLSNKTAMHRAAVESILQHKRAKHQRQRQVCSVD